MADNQKTGDSGGLLDAGKSADNLKDEVVKKKKRRRRRPSRRVIDETKKITEAKLDDLKKVAVVGSGESTNVAGDGTRTDMTGVGEEVVAKKKKRRRRKKKPAGEFVPPTPSVEEPAREVSESANRDDQIIDRDEDSGAGRTLAEEPLVEQPSEEEVPVVEPMTEDPLVVEPMAEEAPLEEPPVEEPLVEEAPLEEPPVEEPLVEEAPVEEPSAEEPLVEEPPVEELLAEEEPRVVYDYQETPREGENVQVYPLSATSSDDQSEQEVIEPDSIIEPVDKPAPKESWAELMERSKKQYEQEHTGEEQLGDEQSGEEAEVSEAESEVSSVAEDLEENDLDAEFVEKPSSDDAELLGEKKSPLDAVANVMKQAGHVFFSVFNLRIIIWLVVSVGLIWGGFWAYGQRYHETIINIFSGKEKLPEIILDLTDPAVLVENGIQSALVFGSNAGTQKDYIPEEIWLAGYFGTLSEPKETGETGISAATYFGELMDEKSIVNMFVEFVEVLQKMQNLYNVDVYALLDRTSEREDAFSEYLEDLTDVRDEANNKYAILKINIDELKVSYNSLGPDKDKFEEDFFVSMESLEPEKSDYLLKAFVDASQKQVALKARVAALEQLAVYYENAFTKLERRISAVEQNREALVRGIRVVEVPGAGIDLIIKAEAE